MRFYQGLAYHGIDRDSLPYKAPFQPYASYFGIFFISIIIVFNGFQVFLTGSWDTSTFVSAYIGLVIFLVFCIFWKIVTRPVFVRLADMDFTTGRRELDMSTFDDHFGVSQMSDYICTVEEEEIAKFVEPEGILAEVWDRISKCRSHQFKLHVLTILSCPV